MSPRILPSSPDAEKAALSSLLLSPIPSLAICASRRVTADWFTIPAHRTIHTCLCELSDRPEPVDFISLTQYLRDRSLLDSCGGPAFVTGLFTYLPTAANLTCYLDILEEKHLARRLIVSCTSLAARGYDEQDDIRSLVDEAERTILSIRSTAPNDTLSAARPAVLRAVQSIESLYERRGRITGLSFGYPALDRVTDGLHPAEMIVIAARPSMGKTALAMNIAEHIALDLELPVAVFSLEMSTHQLMQRLLCSRARVNLARVRDGYLSERDFPALQAAASRIASARLFIDDASALSIQDFRARARRLHQQHQVAAIFVDYLQLMRSTTRRGQSDRQLEIAEISSGLKSVAKELAIPIVVLAQLNRSPEKRTGGSRGRPQLGDLRESGAIEQDADLVALLHRPEYYAASDEEREDLRGQAGVIIAKQRNGPIGEIPLTFLHEYSRFESAAWHPDPPGSDGQGSKGSGIDEYCP